MFSNAKSKNYVIPMTQLEKKNLLSFSGSVVCLPSDTTYELYTGSMEGDFVSDDDDNDSTSASEPCEHYHHQSVIINHSDSNAKKSGSSEDGVHFITDEPVGTTITVEDNPEGLAEPEVRKQVGWHPDALRTLETTAIGHRNRRPGAGALRRKNRAWRNSINRYLDRGRVVSILRPRI